MPIIGLSYAQIIPIVMIDDSVAMNSGPVLRLLGERLRALRLTPVLIVVLGAVFVLAAFVVMGRLTLADGVAAGLAIGLAGALAVRVAAKGEEKARTQAEGTAVPARVEQFSDTLAEPCMIVNERSVLLHANRAALARFPRARAGDPLAFTLRDPELIEAIDAVLRTGEPQSAELHITAPNDTWFRASLGPYETSDSGDSRFVVITLYDLTEQKRTDRMRGDFVAYASHELRTPLTSLMGFIDTLQGPAAKDADARERFLGIMRSQAQRMSGLIDDLLSLSRIELRQHVKPTAQVELNHLLREVAESMEPRLKEAGIALDLALPEDSIVVTGDRQELFEVVENLTDNAIKYGGDGGRIEIALATGASRTGDHHAITVTDFGAGVAEMHVPRLTERFYRVDAESSRKKKGTGLGLAIVKHIVQRHHGQLNIRSKVGEGTRVEILLPQI